MTVSRWLARAGVAVLFALCVSLAGVAPRAADEAPKFDSLPDDTAVATIDGKPVTAAELRVAFQFLPQQYYFLPAEFLLETVLNQMIDVRLMANAALAEGVKQDEIERQVVFYRERLLRQAYLKKRAEAEITPELVKQRYEEMSKAAPAEDEVRAHHILVKTEDEAKAISDQLAKGGNFEALAKEKSIDETSAKNGGDLGYFTKSKMVPEFAEVAFATEVGKNSAPVQSQFGWHVIHVDDKRPAKPPTFEEVVPQVRDQLTAELVERAAKTVRASAKIEIAKLDPYAVLGLPKPPETSAAEEKKDGAPASDQPAAKDAAPTE